MFYALCVPCFTLCSQHVQMLEVKWSLKLYNILRRKNIFKFINSCSNIKLEYLAVSKLGKDFITSDTVVLLNCHNSIK